MKKTEKRCEYMEQNSDRTVRLLRTLVVLNACVLLVVVLVGVLLTAQFASVSRCVDVIGQDVQKIDMDALNGAVESFTEAAEQFSSIDMEEVNRAVAALQQTAQSLDMEEFNRTVAVLQTAAENLGGMDMRSLNDAISSLKRAAETFGEIDVASFNKVVQALETAATNLQNAGNAITGIFRR